MTSLNYTFFRVGRIGPKKYAIGLHPHTPETLLSIREFGKRVGYVLPLSALRVHAALSFGRAEQASKREARKNGVPWRVARRVFLASIMPPTIKQRRKSKGGAL